MIEPIKTERLLLRDIVEDDFDAIHSYASNPVATHFMVWGPNNAEETKAFVRDCIDAQEQTPRKSYSLAMTLDDGRVIGVVDLRLGDLKYRHGFIGYIVHPDFWRQGYASEAAAEILRFGFEQCKLHRISTDCDTENYGSVGVLEKIGMMRERRIRDHYTIHGTWRDSYVYAMLESEWKTQQPGNRTDSRTTKLIIINGAPGVGKTTVSKTLMTTLDRCVWLDGDWCWTANPWIVTEETKRMALSNMTDMLSRFLRCSEYRHIIFSWIFRTDDLVEELLGRLPARSRDVIRITLTCDQNLYRQRLEKAGRSKADIERHVATLGQCSQVNSIQIDTSNIGAAQVAGEVLIAIEQT